MSDYLYNLEQELKTVKEQRDELLSALEFALETVHDLAAYADDYFKEKYCFEADVQKIKNAIDKVFEADVQKIKDAINKVKEEK